MYWVVLCVGTAVLGKAAASWGQGPVASLQVTVNTARVALGGILRVDVATENLSAGVRADLYAGVLVPGAGLFFRQADGAFSAAPAALAPGTAVAAGTTRILDLALPPSLPSGTYTFFAAYVRAGAQPTQANLASNLATADAVVGPATVSFQTQVRPIFNANCTSCHVGPFPSGGQDLATDPYRAIVDRPALGSFQGQSLPRIDPGRPQNSYFLRKLQGAPGIDGSRMPLGRAPLPQDLIETIRTWISEGTPNN